MAEFMEGARIIMKDPSDPKVEDCMLFQVYVTTHDHDPNSVLRLVTDQLEISFIGTLESFFRVAKAIETVTAEAQHDKNVCGEDDS